MEGQGHELSSHADVVYIFEFEIWWQLFFIRRPIVDG